jgi:S-(hydroxymethyl)glutathione dehydrogenase / alcohol dehydrogenase
MVTMIARMKTKGALLWELNSPFRIDEIELGDPVDDEVQLRMHAAGMCHSDYHLTTGATPITLPALGGHEGAGVVTKVGKNVKGLEEGDHVILAFIPACGECPPCLKGFRSLCDRGALLLGGKAIADGTSRVHAGSHEVSPMNLLGTFAPYMTVHKDSVVKIDADIPFETAAIMGCALPTGFGSATNVAEVQPGETVIVVGVGGIGMSALQGAALSGAKHVIAIDPVEFKREQAIKFGATHVYPTMAEAIMPIMELTYGIMAQKTIIAVGEMRGEMIEEAMILTAKTGTCVVTGMGSMMDADVKLNLFLFTMLQKTLKGNIFGGGSSHVETPRLVGLYKSGLLKVDEMVTATYRLEDINSGYQDMLDGKNIRGVITFDEADW